MSLRQQILDRLTDGGVPYQLVEHPAALTMEDMESFGVTRQGLIAKNLFLRDHKGKQHFLVVVAGDKQVDLKTLGGLLGTRLSFASEERLEKYLHLQKGAVTPLGVLLDEGRDVEVIWDEDLAGQACVGVHPADNTATVLLCFEDLARLVADHGSKSRFVRL